MEIRQAWLEQGSGGGGSGRGVAWNGERGSVFTGVKWGTEGEQEMQIKKKKNRGVRRRFSVAVMAKSYRLPEGKDSFLTDSRVLIDLPVSNVLVCTDKKATLMDFSNTHIPSPQCILTHMHACPQPNLSLSANLISGTPSHAAII